MARGRTRSRSCAGRVAIVLGSEAAACGDMAGERSRPSALPMHGMADSLNVSVAAAVLLYEARRQRDASRRNQRTHPTDEIATATDENRPEMD